MNNEMLGLKEIYNCILKSTYEIEVNGKKIKPGEPILVFDKIQMANFDEVKKRVDASGGYQNVPLISWESTKEVAIRLTQGVLSTVHFAFLGNSNIEKTENIEVPKEEFKKEIDENKEIQLQRVPSGNLFVYDYDTGLGLDYELTGKVLSFPTGTPYQEVNIYYDFIAEKATMINVGRNLLNGYLTLQGKTRLKDDRTGKVVTGVLKFPKIKLMSDFSIRLGEDVPPNIGVFSMSALPVGVKGSEKVMDFIILKDDIDADY